MGVVFPYLNMIDPGGSADRRQTSAQAGCMGFPKELLNADHSGQGPVSGGMRRD
jgi:hypothetical protein